MFIPLSSFTHFVSLSIPLNKLINVVDKDYSYSEDQTDEVEKEALAIAKKADLISDELDEDDDYGGAAENELEK